jgi:hypothetical protein
METVPFALWQVILGTEILGTEMGFQLPKFCCPECNSYLADVKKTLGIRLVFSIFTV